MYTKAFVYIFFVIHFFIISKEIYQFFKINKCIKKLENFINAYTKNHYPFNNYQKELDDLLKFYPLICEFRDCYSPQLFYGDYDSANFSNSQKLYNSFLMDRNFITQNIKHSVNPFNTIKEILCFPSTALKLLRIKPRKIPEILINIFVDIFVGIILLLLDMFSDEIKTFIFSYIQNFINK